MLKKLCWIGLVAGMGACSSMSIDSAQSPDVDMSTMSTFHWMDRPQPQVSRRADREHLDERIRAAVDQGLIDRGLEKVEGPDVDLVFAYYVGLDGATDVMRVNNYPDDRFGVGRGWELATVGSQSTMESGTLVLDAFDARTGLLAWRGVAEAQINRTDAPEKRAELVNEAVRKLLQEFPIGG